MTATKPPGRGFLATVWPPTSAELSRRQALWLGLWGGATAIGLDDASAAPAAGRHVLIMFDRDNCPYCKRWHAEIGSHYGRTEEGRFAPLLRRQIAAPAPDFIKDVRYTPTFVLTDGERELGRIVGYSGPDFFWANLSVILAKAGFKPQPEAPAVETRSL
jgi:Thioredoxin-like domain